MDERTIEQATMLVARGAELHRMYSVLEEAREQYEQERIKALQRFEIETQEINDNFNIAIQNELQATSRRLALLDFDDEMRDELES